MAREIGASFQSIAHVGWKACFGLQVLAERGCRFEGWSGDGSGLK